MGFRRPGRLLRFIVAHMLPSSHRRFAAASGATHLPSNPLVRFYSASSDPRLLIRVRLSPPWTARPGRGHH